MILGASILDNCHTPLLNPPSNLPREYASPSRLTPKTLIGMQSHRPRRRFRILLRALDSDPKGILGAHGRSAPEPKHLTIDTHAHHLPGPIRHMVERKRIVGMPGRIEGGDDHFARVVAPGVWDREAGGGGELHGSVGFFAALGDKPNGVDAVGDFGAYRVEVVFDGVALEGAVAFGEERRRKRGRREGVDKGKEGADGEKDGMTEEHNG